MDCPLTSQGIHGVMSAHVSEWETLKTLVGEMQPWGDRSVQSDLLCQSCIEILGMRCDTDAPEVQSIRIPARSDRRVFMMMAIRVPGAGVVKTFE